MNNPEEQGNRRPNPQEATSELEFPEKGNRIRVELGGGQVQMVEYPDLEVVEGQPKPEISEYDLVHRECILRELPTDASIPRRPHYLKVPLKSFLTTAILDDGISLSTTKAID